MKVLIVVDCQPCFGISDDMDLVRNTVKKIREFKRRNDPIIVLEFRHNGRTVDSITKLVKKYPNGVFLEKSYNDGSDEIQEYLYNHVFAPKIEEVQFCGVNLNVCVIDTAIGLGEKYPAWDMTILYECCGAHDNMDYATGWVLRVQKQYANICLVNTAGPMF